MTFCKHSLEAADLGVSQRDSGFLRVGGGEGETPIQETTAGKLNMEGRGGTQPLGPRGSTTGLVQRGMRFRDAH